MRAHELIFETSNPRNAFRSQPKTWQDLEQALPRIQTAIDQFQKGVCVYRGLTYVDVDNPVLFKPQMPKGTRSSANTKNYYTLFIDNNVKWKNYPSRSASIIATDILRKASNYGYRYLLLPEGDPVIGVANNTDFWTSFPRLEEDLMIDSLDTLNYAITNIMKDWLNKLEYKPASWEEFKKDLQQIDQINYLSFPNLPKKDEYLPFNIRNLLNFHPGTTMEEKLDYLLDPRANGFKLTNLSEFIYDKNQNHEIWFSSPCWLIYYNELPFHRSSDFNLEDWIKQKAAEEQHSYQFDK